MSTVVDPSGGMALSADGHSLVTAVAASTATTGALAAINTADGSTQWSQNTGAVLMLAFASVFALDNTFVVPSYDGSIHGYDARTGQQVWQKRFPSAVLGKPDAVGGRVWVALQSGQVVGLDNKGAVTASFEGFGTSIAAISVAQKPVEANGVVIVVAGSIIFGVKVGG